jgi:hypothetical protein
VGEISRDVELAGYESAGIGPSRFWLTTRIRAIHRMRALMAPLLLLLNEQSSATQNVAHRLDLLANDLSSESGLNEVAALSSPNGLPDNFGKHHRDSSTVAGLVLSNLDLLESELRDPGGVVSADASV